MSATYAKGTRVWLPDTATGWVAGTVSSLTLPAEQTAAASVTLVVTLDDDDSQSRTLKFPLSALEKAGDDIQPASPPPGQDALPPLRNPPLLESSEDLASLSNLNEPSGELLGSLYEPS